ISDQPADAGRSPGASSAIDAAVRWLLDLQNRDGGWPTFCRGWGALPFDRSAADLTAHALRALMAYRETEGWLNLHTPIEKRSDINDFVDDVSIRMQHGVADVLDASSAEAIQTGLRFLQKTQRPDGSWLPLWFGNQHAPDDVNPTYGTARVLAAYRDCDRLDTEPARRGLQWLADNQNDDGGWGGIKATPSSIEEASLAVEILLSSERHPDSAERGLTWLLDRVEDGSFHEPSPIGFYFAKLWYFERLYPLIFLTAALRRACTLKPDICTTEPGRAGPDRSDTARLC
ncbi:MAG: hypothetical protein ACREJB_07240, partial [Planctomycetaceae bacterium]